MIWLGWRQLRGAALMSGAVLLLAAVMWIVTGPQLRQAGNVADAFRLVQLINTTMIAVPALIGAFWGARWWRASTRPAPTGWPGRRA